MQNIALHFAPVPVVQSLFLYKQLLHLEFLKEFSLLKITLFTKFPIANKSPLLSGSRQN